MKAFFRRTYYGVIYNNSERYLEDFGPLFCCADSSEFNPSIKMTILT